MLKDPIFFKACLLILTLLLRFWMHHSLWEECFPISPGLHAVILLIVKCLFFWGKMDLMVNGCPGRHRGCTYRASARLFCTFFSRKNWNLHCFFSLKELLFFCGNKHLNSLIKKKKKRFIIVTRSGRCRNTCPNWHGHFHWGKCKVE